jgi:phage terminase small subunit
MKQQLFCQEFVVDMNATQAALRAGYSKNGARNQGSRLLANEGIRSEISRLVCERAERTSITVDMVISELAKIAFGSIGDLVNWDSSTVTLIEKGLIPKDAIAAISEISETVTAGGTVTTKVSRESKVKCLELLGKYLSMFTDRHIHEGNKDAPILILPDVPRTIEENN